MGETSHAHGKGTQRVRLPDKMEQKKDADLGKVANTMRNSTEILNSTQTSLKP